MDGWLVSLRVGTTALASIPTRLFEIGAFETLLVVLQAGQGSARALEMKHARTAGTLHVVPLRQGRGGHLWQAGPEAPA